MTPIQTTADGRTVRRADDDECRATHCFCHDDDATAPAALFCSWCGCQWVEADDEPDRDDVQ